MTVRKQSSQSPCHGQDVVVTMEKVIEVIRKTDHFEDDDARTCFWMFVDGLNGDSKKRGDFKMVLTAMKDHRPKAHAIILAEATRILNS